MARFFDEGSLLRGGHARHADGPGRGARRRRQAPRRRRGVRLRQGRRPHGVRRRLRLHREGREHRRDRRGEGHAHARDGPQGAHPWCGSSTRPARASSRGLEQRGRDLALRGLGAPLPRGGDHVGVVPQVAAMVGPGAAGTAYIPGPRGLRADGEEHRLHGPRGPAAGQGRHGPGDRRAGPRRVEGALRPRAAWATARYPDDAAASPRCASTSRTSPRTATKPRPVCPAPTRSTAARSRCSTSCPRRGAPTTCTSSSARWSTTASVRHQAPLRAQPHHLPRAHQRRSVGVVANNPMHLGGVLDVDAADKGAHFIQLCDAFNIPLVFFQDTPGLHGGLEGRARGHHPARRQDAPRDERGHGAEAHRGGAEGLRRGVLRDVRPRLRARPHRGLARRRDLRDGRRGHGGHRGEEALPRRGARRPR
jgi:hypothetical protein